MRFLKVIIFTSALFYLYSLKASEVTVIELHQNKSLDQLVLEQEKNKKNVSDLDSADLETEDQNSTPANDTEENNSNLNQDDEVETTDLQSENNEQNLDLEDVALIEQENIFIIDETSLQKYLEIINNIKSPTLHKEFLKIISNPAMETTDKDINKKFFLIKKLYDMGEIRKSYNVIKESNLDLSSNKEYYTYLKKIELNYLLSTYKLSEVCELKSQLLDESIVLPNSLLEKTDIFCLTIDNKLSEARLLNSLLLDKEQSPDLFFQQLFDYTVLEKKEGVFFEPIKSLQTNDLIFLYSAMLRINELPLTEKLIEIDPFNLSIPVILSDPTPMQIRLKAVNKSYYDNLVTVDILSALYQSADFNSQQFNKPDETIQSFGKNNELIMAFYYQLANRQIFPEDRLQVIIEYWEFAKNIGLEKIAYSLTENIIQTFTPSSDTSTYSMQIAMAHISNSNFAEASKWLNFIDDKGISKSQLEYVKFLIELNENNELNTIISFLESLNNSINNEVDITILETIDVLNRFLDIDKKYLTNFNYENILDQRVMPSYFLITNLNQHIEQLNNMHLFMLATISMENKDWHELHPEHLLLILKAFSSYDQGLLIKPIILEILSDLNVTK